MMMYDRFSKLFGTGKYVHFLLLFCGTNDRAIVLIIGHERCGGGFSTLGETARLLRFVRYSILLDPPQQ
jgi:hypothetical protein